MAARRAQVIEAAITTENGVGYHALSLAQIVPRARRPKIVISYHFGHKEELLREVVQHVLADSTPH